MYADPGDQTRSVISVLPAINPAMKLGNEAFNNAIPRSTRFTEATACHMPHSLGLARE